MTLTNLLTEQAEASLAHKIVSSEQVRLLEPQAAAKAKCSLFDLMCKAGEASFTELKRHWPQAQQILVLAGNGNNGGDGYVLASLAKQAGMTVQLVCEDPNRILSGDAKRAQANWFNAGGKSEQFATADLADADVIVDALLGTGCVGAVKAPFLQLIDKVNQCPKPVLSVDIPSGLHGDTGQLLATCIKADKTISFVALKTGLVTGIAKHFTGELHYVDLGIGAEFFALAEQQAQLVDWSMLKPLPNLPVHANKGTFGKVLCIGGNQGMAGAIRLTSEAVLRTGAGLVKVFCHPDSNVLIGAGRPEIMLTNNELEQALKWCSCLVMGPGLGQDEWAYQVASQTLTFLKRHPKPLVLDADGLNFISARDDKLSTTKLLADLPELVLTPHPGEASRLLNTDTECIEKDRYLAAMAIAKQYHGCCILKGAGSLIHSTDSINKFICWIAKGGNPGMASGGMGDLLTGIIGAFLATGMPANQAAIYAVCAHNEAADRLATQYGQRGMIASDLLQPLRAIVNGF